MGDDDLRTNFSVPSVAVSSSAEPHVIKGACFLGRSSHMLNLQYFFSTIFNAVLTTRLRTAERCNKYTEYFYLPPSNASLFVLPFF